MHAARRQGVLQAWLKFASLHIHAQILQLANFGCLPDLAQVEAGVAAGGLLHLRDLSLRRRALAQRFPLDPAMPQVRPAAVCQFIALPCPVRP